VAEVERFALLASAIARRPLRVAAGEPGELAWTDGDVIFVDALSSPRTQVESLVVQASLLAAGSLDREIVRGLAPSPALARRYLSIEGHRALTSLEAVLPLGARPRVSEDVARGTDSAARSLAIAQSGQTFPDPPLQFGAIRAKRLLSSARSAERASATSPLARARQNERLADFAEEGAEEGETREDPFSGSVGGGGVLGRWLARLLTPVRQLRGGGPPGADAPTHWTPTGKRRGSRSVVAIAALRGAEDAPSGHRDRTTKYPEWDAEARRYREDWCTVVEAEAAPTNGAPAFAVPDRAGLRRVLARLGLGIDRVRRQSQGDDVDIDAVIEEEVERRAGASPEQTVFVDSVRRRRDLSVLLLLDVSGSAAEAAADGKTVHEQQRAAAAMLALALHELGDRVALYAYHSRGRSAVQLVAVKRFRDESRALVTQRLGSLEPGGYSRLGAAIRHGSAVLQEQGGTPRRLLVVLSDGLAYDHGYEPAYGAADARRALGEARRQGIGCLCLSVGAATEDEALARVFGASAHATVPTPGHLGQVMGPLVHAAIRSADVRRRPSRGAP
jgi:hypothetical protein